MFESKYLCTLDLFTSIPTLDESKTVTQEIFEWNEMMKTSSKSRLFRHGHRVDAPKFGLSEKHILTIERLGVEPEAMLGRSSIADQFDPSFFETDFWFMWCTTFAFQPWHSAVEFKRYLVALLIWCQASTHCTGSCEPSTTNTTRWSDRYRNGWRAGREVSAEHPRHGSWSPP